MDAMISLQCSSSETIAKELNQYVRDSGYTTWICIEMHGGSTYREEIVVNASGSKILIALMNVKWAESKECRYEFNIALRSQLTKGTPHIIPIILENFDFHVYPTITGVMANTNAIFYNPKDPKGTFEQVVSAMRKLVTPHKIPEKVQHVAAAIAEQKLPEKIEDWKIEHTAQWFHSLHLPHSSKDIFEKNWVDGPMLLELDQKEMVESMNLTGLQAKRLAREINDLVRAQFNSNPVEQNLEVLHSHKGFDTGIWEGYYQYPSGKRDETTMDATMIAGVVSGYGSDVTGDFLIQGTYDDDTLDIIWDKTYIGKHVVFYNGKLAGKTISGTWKVGGHSGPFQLTKKA